jgi:hypothetical protein
VGKHPLRSRSAAPGAQAHALVCAASAVTGMAAEITWKFLKEVGWRQEVNDDDSHTLQPPSESEFGQTTPVTSYPMLLLPCPARP